jgi:type VI protein secretion system component VasF
MPTSRRTTQIDSPEAHRRAVEEVQRLEATATGSRAEKRRAALLASIEDYERRLDEKNHRKGRPRVDKRRAGGRRT